MAYQALTQDMTDEEFDWNVGGILAQEPGPRGFARDLMLHRSGPRDYTAERHQWLSGIRLDDLGRDFEKPQ